MGLSRARSARRPEFEPLDARLLLSGVPTPDHVVIAIEENHAFSEIIGSPYAPYINSLAQEGALFTQSFAIEHPSQPNYLDLFSGSNQGVTDDNPPAQAPFTTPNLGAELIAAGRTFAGYSEGLPAVGSTAITSGAYARRHNPWVEWQGSSTDAIPAEDNLPLTDFPTDFSALPTVSFVVPNVNDDMHDGTDPGRIQNADTWLESHLGPYVQWAQAHNSLFILTFDEDDASQSNQITTLFVGPMVKPGQYGETINHFSVLRTVEGMYGLPYAGASATASPITDVWQTAGPAAHLVVSAPSSTTAGAAFSITVTAEDANGQTAAGYLGTIHFTSSDALAGLPADYSFTAADAGVHTFVGGAILKTAGAQQIIVTDEARPGVAGTPSSITVAPAAASRLVVSGPTRVYIGVPFSMTVTAIDPYGNTATGYVGTVHFSRPNPFTRGHRRAASGRAVLPADYIFTASDAGTHIFPDVEILKAQGPQSITVADTVSRSLTATLAGIVVKRRRGAGRILAVSAPHLRRLTPVGTLTPEPSKG